MRVAALGLLLSGLAGQLLYDILSLKNYVNVASKGTQIGKQLEEKNNFYLLYQNLRIPKMLKNKALTPDQFRYIPGTYYYPTHPDLYPLLRL